MDESLLRFYDRERDLVVMFQRDVGEQPDVSSQLRQETQANPSRFIPINPVASKDQLALLRRLLDELPPTHRRRPALERALAQPLWFHAFKSAMADDRALDLDWKLRWNQHVFDAIKTWATAHGVEIPNLVARRREKTQDVRSTGSAPRGKDAPVDPVRLPGRGQTTSEIRTRILRALERLTLEELLALRVPAHLLLDDE